MSDPLADLSTAIADRYRLDRELGRGGMATVRLALDLKHDRPVAIKVLLPELAASLGAERFLQEIKLTAQLNHPHILPLLDSGSVNGLLYYVMPFVEGKSLRERLDREKQLPLEEGVRIVLQVTDAVEYAHRHGIIHRDIKPENVLLDEGHAVVTDFGIARAVNVASEGRLTGSGMALGTPAYMSPEQATGSSTLDGRSDVYALGCLLYEVLAGQPPFTGASAESVIRQHLLAEPRPISDVRAGVPAQVVAALERALAKTPSDRFPSARAFGEALGSASSSGAVATPSRRRLPSRSRMLAAALLVVLVGALGVWAIRRPAPAAQPKVAVLPLRNLSADSSASYFVQAMHEDLGTRIGMIPKLSVTSRNSVLRFHPGETPTATIASELGVDFLLEGSVRLDSQRVNVAVQLIDARDDTQLWSQAYARDRSVASLIDIQADIASRLAEALRVRLSAAVRGRLGDHPTESMAAYELFLRASQLPSQSDPEANNAAEELLKQAIALDPQFLEASAALAHVYVSRTYLLGRSRAWADSGLVLARQALRADSTLDVALDALGFLYLDLGRLTQARAVYSKLLELRPSSGRALLVLGWIDFLRGRLAEAVGYWNHARIVDPMNATVAGDMHLVEMLFGDVERANRWKALEVKLDRRDGIGEAASTRLLLWQGKAAEALQSAEVQLRTSPRSYVALGLAARAAIEAGKLELARQYLGEMERASPDDWDYWGTTYRTSYAYVLSRLGERARANELLEQTLRQGVRLIEEGDERPGVRREIAAIHAALGHQDDAYLWLDRAIEAGWRQEAIEPNTLFRALHGEPRFKASTARINLDIAVARQRVREGDHESR